MKELSPFGQKKLEMIWPVFCAESGQILDLRGIAEALRRDGTPVNILSRQILGPDMQICWVLSVLELEGVLCVSLKERGWEPALKNLEKEHATLYTLGEHVETRMFFRVGPEWVDSLDPSVKPEVEKQLTQARTILDKIRLDENVQRVSQNKSSMRL